MPVTEAHGLEVPSTCAEQETRLILVYVVTVAFVGLTQVLTGMFMDRFGKFLQEQSISNSAQQLRRWLMNRISDFHNCVKIEIAANAHARGMPDISYRRCPLPFWQHIARFRRHQPECTHRAPGKGYN